MIPRKLISFALLFHNAAEKGIVLLIAALFAIIAANSNLAHVYHHFLHTNLSIAVGDTVLEMHIIHWINDFLMAIFFLVVGSEIKREMLEGYMAKKEQRILPVVAAIAGVVVPLIIYVIFNFNSSDTINMRGWAVPAATDIAFALGMLALFGKGLPISLRVFLTALAIIDDLIAIIFIAIFYTSSLEASNFIYIIICFIILNTMRKEKYPNISLYLLVGLFMWYFFLKSGVHATISGVVLGFCIPLKSNNGQSSPLKNLEHSLYPLVYYFILPVFAFANSGVYIQGMTLSGAFNSVSLGIMAGLFIGKQLGIFGTVVCLKYFKIIDLPEKSTLLQFYGVSILCGIGFTMSLLIAALGFSGYAEYFNNAQLGVLLGSLFSSVLAAFILNLTRK